MPAIMLAGSLRAADFSVPEADLPHPLMFIAYGDMRFTDPRETGASQPAVRQALVAKVAAERPAAIFVNGDVPWRGVTADYDVFRDETRPWREQRLRVYPALGNHEFSGCNQDDCMARWWSAFPEQRGRRWYSVALGSKLLALVLDSTSSLLPGSAQRSWLEDQINALGTQALFVLIVLHHPPQADVQTVKLVDHNPRPNELALADYLSRVSLRAPARLVVSAGHIHNYERLERDGVVYLVSGGGGALPYEVDRTPPDHYQDTDFPNYHYVRFELHGKTLSGEMIRLADYAAPKPNQWDIRDRFEITLPP
jgi:acid phosphatase type 7